MQYYNIIFRYGGGLFLTRSIFTFCVSFSSLSGASSWCGFALASRMHSSTRHLFCRAVGVSFAAPCVGSSMIVTGLGVCDRSCMSLVSQSMYLSPAGGFDGWASVCAYSTRGSHRVSGSLALRRGWDRSCPGHSLTTTRPPWARKVYPSSLPTLHHLFVGHRPAYALRTSALGPPLVFACFVMEHQSDPRHHKLKSTVEPDVWGRQSPLPSGLY